MSGAGAAWATPINQQRARVRRSRVWRYLMGVQARRIPESLARTNRTAKSARCSSTAVCRTLLTATRGASRPGAERTTVQRERLFVERETLFAEREGSPVERETLFVRRETLFVQRERLFVERKSLLVEPKGSSVERERLFVQPKGSPLE